MILKISGRNFIFTSGSVPQPLENDSPGSGDDLRTKSELKNVFFSDRKMISKKKLRFFFRFFRFLVEKIDFP